MNQQKTGEFLKLLRKEKGVTQEQLAEVFSVSSRTVSRWEKNANNGFPKGASHPLVGVEGATPHRRRSQAAKYLLAPAGAALEAHLKGEF